MRWLRKRGADSEHVFMDVAERLTGRGRPEIDHETTALTDRETVRRWLRELHHARDEQVLVHRPWGTVAAVADDRRPVGVIRSDGEHSWFAVPPGGAEDQALTPEQVEHIVLEALTAAEPPTWPDWHSLT